MRKNIIVALDNKYTFRELSEKYPNNVAAGVLHQQMDDTWAVVLYVSEDITNDREYAYLLAKSEVMEGYSKMDEAERDSVYEKFSVCKIEVDDFTVAELAKTIMSDILIPDNLRTVKDTFEFFAPKMKLSEDDVCNYCIYYWKKSKAEADAQGLSNEDSVKYATSRLVEERADAYTDAVEVITSVSKDLVQV